MGKGNGPFWWYMMHIKKKTENSGGKNISVDEAVKFADKLWGKMSNAERQNWFRTSEEYRDSDLRKKDRENSRTLLRPAKTPHREGLEADKQMAASQRYYDLLKTDEAKKFLRKRLLNRRQLVEWLIWRFQPSAAAVGMAALFKEIFYTITCVPYVVNDGVVVPAELCLAGFSIRKGLKKKHYVFRLRRHKSSEEEHDGDGEGGGSVDYATALKRITHITADSKFLFVASANYNDVVGGLNYMLEEGSGKKVDGRTSEVLRPERFACLEDLAAATFLLAMVDKEKEEISDTARVDELCGRFGFDVGQFHLPNSDALIGSLRFTCQLNCSAHKGKQLLCALYYAKEALRRMFLKLSGPLALELGVSHTFPIPNITRGDLKTDTAGSPCGETESEVVVVRSVSIQTDGEMAANSDEWVSSRKSCRGGAVMRRKREKPT